MILKKFFRNLLPAKKGQVDMGLYIDFDIESEIKVILRERLSTKTCDEILNPENDELENEIREALEKRFGLKLTTLNIEEVSISRRYN